VTDRPTTQKGIIPQTIVADAQSTLDFIEDVFGATIEEVYEGDGVIYHSQARIGDSRIMVATANEEFPPFPAMLNVYVDDVDDAFARALDRGATPLREPEDQFYGDRTGGVVDSQGNQWWISTHVEDVSEEEIRRRMGAD